MTNQQLRFWRSFFLRLFLFSALVAIVIFTTTELTKESMMKSLQLSEQEFRRDVMNSMVIFRVWLMFILLPLVITFQTLIKKNE